MSDLYAIYLRKSRADLEAEARGEGETLERHRRALTQLADQRGLRVVRVYEEIVSGDTIASRPQVQALLEDVQAGAYAGVIVNDIDRLARGDGIDQEIVKQSFAFSGTKIITPYKDYDLADQSDEDQIEFKLFLGRFEYKAIKRRLQTGRTRAALEGNYISGCTPYGYIKVYSGKRIDLEILDDEADVVRMIFGWFAEGIGYAAIATKLNDMGVRTRQGNPWSRVTVRSMLKNPIYVGDWSYGRQKQTAMIEGGKRVKKLTQGTPTVMRDVFPAIIDRDAFDAAQAKFGATQSQPHTRYDMKLSNPLAGLIQCSVCGKTMQKLPSSGKRPILHCGTYNCPTRGIYVETLEGLIIEEVRRWEIECEAQPQELPAQDLRTEALSRRLAGLEKQMNSLHDLVESGVYTVQEFVTRRAELQSKIDALRESIAAQKNAPSRPELLNANRDAIRYVADAYDIAETAEEKNRLLKSVIDHVDYEKTVTATKAENPSDFLTLTIYPKLVI